MLKGLIFFCCACAILIFTIINLSIGPIVSRTVGTTWSTMSCAYYSDLYDKDKKDSTCDDKCLKYGAKWNLHSCQRKKAMYNMEYTSFVFDIVIGFVCGLLGLLHHFEVKKEFVHKTGLIGLICGVVGFVLSFIYVIYNGLVYTTDDYVQYLKRNGDGAVAELKGNGYECFYFDDPKNDHSIYAKYSDLGKKQYNYNKDLIESYQKNEINECILPNPSVCSQQKNIIGKRNYNNGNNECKYLYLPATELIYDIRNKNISDRFLTTLILSLLVCLANIGLALFGFLLFRTPNEF